MEKVEQVAKDELEAALCAPNWPRCLEHVHAAIAALEAQQALSDGEIYSLASFGGDKEAKAAFINSLKLQAREDAGDVEERVAYAIIEGQSGKRAAEHAKEFCTSNWTYAIRSAREVLAALPDTGARAALEAENRRLNKLIDHLSSFLKELTDELEDEGDRIYFGSTNHADQLRELANEFDMERWDKLIASQSLPSTTEEG